MALKSAKKHTVRHRRLHHRSRKGGLTPAEGVKWKDSDLSYMAEGSKKSFKPTTVRKTKGGRTKKVRGGYYGFDGPLATGAVNWGRGSEMQHWADNDPKGQGAIVGSGRRRTSRKGGKKSRKTRRVKRGGGKYGGVSASFEGEGERGLANFAGRTSRDNPGVAAEGKFNNFGAQPGSGFGSFVKV